MKKMLFFIAMAMLMQFQSQGHATITKRDWCGGIFHRKFVAYAQTVAYYMSYRSAGYNYLGQMVNASAISKTSVLCTNEAKGCSRPQVAECGTNSGNINDVYYNSMGWLTGSYSYPYTAHAKASCLVGSDSYIKDHTGRGDAGFNDSVQVDSAKFLQLVAGWSHGDITGPIELTGNTLTIQNLTGTLSIQPGTDGFSTFKVLIIKERDDISEAEAQQADELAKNGVFNNIVASGTIYVSKGNISVTGLFNGVTGISNITTPGSFGVNLSNVNLTQAINVSLLPNEHLTLIGMIDGGFDVSSAIRNDPPPPPPPMAKPTSIENSLLAGNNSGQVEFYPNPASGYINCKVFAASPNEKITIKAFDLSGRVISQVYSGILQQGYSTIGNIDISGLAQGTYIMEVTTGNNTCYQNIVTH